MKTLIMSILLCVAGLATAQPQQAMKNKTPEERATMVTERMKKHLNLSEVQAGQIKAVNLNKAQKVDAIRAKYAQGNKKGMMQEIKPVQAEAEAQYKTILTPEQMAKYVQLREEAKKRKAEKAQNGKGDSKKEEAKLKGKEKEQKAEKSKGTPNDKKAEKKPKANEQEADEMFDDEE